MKDQDGLWLGNDDLATEPAHSPPSQERAANALFGCPLWWVKKVTPLVHGKGELLAAIYLWRLRAIQHNKKTVVLSNSRLSDELGIDRFVKSRMLHRLKRAGLVRVQS
jgi:hypothetical protein